MSAVNGFSMKLSDYLVSISSSNIYHIVLVKYYHILLLKLKKEQIEYWNLYYTNLIPFSEEKIKITKESSAIQTLNVLLLPCQKPFYVNIIDFSDINFFREKKKQLII